MKKIFSLLFIVTMLTISGNAQKTSVGFHAGAVMSKYKITISDVSLTSDYKWGFTGGVVFDVAMGRNFAFQPGLDYLQLGGILREGTDGGTSKLTTNLDYLEVPINFLFKANTNAGKLFLGTGPTIDWGLGGKFKDETGESTTVHFGESENDDLKRFNFGANFLAGFEFKNGFVLSANYVVGLRDLSTIGDASYKGHYFGFRLGYFLPKTIR